jgi:nucleotide-binding universal stress UspA family protein
VPLDGSDLAEAALGPAQLLASKFAAALRVVRVVPKPLELTSIYGMRGVEVSGEGHHQRVEEAETYLEGVMHQQSEGAAVEGGVIESSSAAEGVVEAARIWDADLVALSSHGRGGAERVVLGSVADKVIRGTTRPVLVVRAKPTS